MTRIHRNLFTRSILKLVPSLRAYAKQSSIRKTIDCLRTACLAMVLSLLFFFSKAFAIPAPFDTHGPIQIQSDTASYEQMKQQATYEGNVVMEQGAHLLHADTLTLKKDPTGNSTVITAIGHPARFKGHLRDHPDPVFATAKIIHYYPDKQLILLEGSATLDYQQDKFKGPMLSYQLDKQVVSAMRKQDERPTITIQPRHSKH